MEKIQNWQKAIAFSVGGIILYQLGHWFSLPLMTDESLDMLGSISFFDSNRFSIFSLGIGALLTGFFVIELASFLIPPFKQWRTEGFDGRKKLNLSSLLLSLAVGIWQSYQLVQFLGNSVDFHGNPLLGNFSIFTQTLSVLFYIA